MRLRGGWADQGLEWAGLGPGFLFLVRGDAAGTSTVECVVWFVLQEVFPWAQRCPFTWCMLILPVPCFFPASPGLQGHGMRTECTCPLPLCTHLKPSAVDLQKSCRATQGSVRSLHLSLEGPENNGHLQKVEGTCFPEAPGSTKGKQTGKPFPRFQGPSPPRLLHQPGAALGLIKRMRLAGKLSVQQVIPPVIPDR